MKDSYDQLLQMWREEKKKREKAEDRIKELENSLSIALEINDKYQREENKLKAELARAKEDHQYDNLVHQKELKKLLKWKNLKWKYYYGFKGGRDSLIHGPGLNGTDSIDKTGLKAIRNGKKMNYKEPVPLSKQEKREAMLLGAIVALTYLFALGYYLSWHGVNP